MIHLAHHLRRLRRRHDEIRLGRGQGLLAEYPAAGFEVRQYLAVGVRLSAPTRRSGRRPPGAAARESRRSSPLSAKIAREVDQRAQVLHRPPADGVVARVDVQSFRRRQQPVQRRQPAARRLPQPGGSPPRLGEIFDRLGEGEGRRSRCRRNPFRPRIGRRAPRASRRRSRCRWRSAAYWLMVDG